MSSIFNIDSPIMNFLNKVTNIVILNFCFLVSCIPVVTIGAGLSSLYSVHLKMVKDEESYIFRSYWQAFRENFKVSTICWLILCALGCIFYLDYWASALVGGVAKPVMQGILLALFLCYLVLLLNLFPYIARFEDDAKTCIKNAFMIGLSNIGYTITVALLTAAVLLVTFYSMEVFFRALFLWVFFGMSLLAFLQSFFLRRVLDKYVQEEDITK